MNVELRADRVEHELAHGKRIAEGDPELIWGWATPAGRLRAQRRAELILEAAGAKPGRRLLEVGCGSGMFTELFARSGAEIVAVDLSPDLLALARERDLPEGHIRFLQGRFEDCDAEGPFDAVIGSSVLHHLDVPAALNRIRELLKPGGRMSFAEPNFLNPQIFLERTFRRFFPYVSPDETAFLRTTLQRRLLKSGFGDVVIVPFDWLHPRVPPRLIPAVSKLGRWLEHRWGLREFSGSLLIAASRP